MNQEEAKLFVKKHHKQGDLFGTIATLLQSCNKVSGVVNILKHLQEIENKTNKIKNTATCEKRPGGQEPYEIKITNTKTKEIVYQKESPAGMVCNVERITKFSGGIIEGEHQTAGWGNVIAQFYALQRMQEFFKAKSDEMIDAMETAGMVMSNKEALKKMLRKEGEN